MLFTFCTMVYFSGISFTPREVGDHWVSVFRNGHPIPGSPFKIVISGAEVGNARKVKVFGRGITTGLANEVNEFTIDTKEAGETNMKKGLIILCSLRMLSIHYYQQH